MARIGAAIVLFVYATVAAAGVITVTSVTKVDSPGVFPYHMTKGPDGALWSTISSSAVRSRF